MARHFSSFFLILCNAGMIMGADLLPQRFRVQPKDIRAKEGDEIILPCEVDNRAGIVQWTKDGMALGYERDIPGHPTYSMMGDADKGVYNLKIQNVSLRDDALFECQVGPALKPKQNALRAPARVNVSSPPSSLEMLGHANNTKLVVRVEQELTLQCLARNSRPAAKVSWYRGKSELKLNYTEGITECRKRNGSNVEECDVLSTLIMKPKLSDDSVQLSCVVKHEALLSKMSMFATVQLNVHYPPDTPFIDGYSEGDELQDGQEIELVCRSAGGNPQALLTWYRNRQQIPVFKNSGYGKVSESHCRFQVKPEDNGANYSCDASNSATIVPLSSYVKLSVLFGPHQVTLSGAEEGKAGEVVSVTCVSTSSNPPANIQWTVNGRESTIANTVYSAGLNGGSVATSTLDITVPSQKEEVKVYCYANNPRTSKNAIGSRSIQVHYPPGHPIISGFVKNGYIKSDSELTLTCSSSGGNPLASLTWYKNNKKFSGGTKTSDKTTTSANITIIANKDDNGAIYKCEAINPTIEVPLVANITLNVYFPPEDVVISIRPKELHVGMQVIIQCNATVSNPVAEITWWLNGLPVTDGITSTSQSGLHGGKLAFSELVLDVTAEMNGNTITCQATNPVLAQSKSIFDTLNVKYKPKFSESNHTTTIYKVEGEFFTITFEANGNPADISYEWKKDGKLLSNQHGSTLAIGKLSRKDAGLYTCQATNSEGSSDLISFKLGIKYGASILNISRMIIASNGSDTELNCMVGGNPIEAYHVTWIQPNIAGLEERSEVIFENNTSILKLKRVTNRDAGLFYCVVNNTIGAAVNESASLIIEHAPVIDDRTLNTKVAGNINDMVDFTCAGSGAPELYFYWSKKDTAEHVLKEGSKYSMSNRHIRNSLEYKSTLSIRNVVFSDYGTYVCTVKNKVGESKIFFDLVIKSKPNSPTDLRLVNVTQNSITLSWTLDFDGGEKTRFSIRYYSDSVDGGKYQPEIDAGFNTVYTVQGLQPGVTYIFDVMASNKIGKSSYSMKVNATTIHLGSKLIVELPVDGEGLILIIAAGVGVLLICLNLFIVLICLWRKSKKTKKGISDSGSGKPSTIEMYGPGSRSSNDMGSRVETVSSLQSEKCVHFSTSDDNRNHINDDQNDVPYIIEDINYPFIESNEYELHRRHSTKDILSQKLYGNPYDGYSTIGHGHHLKPMVPQLIPYSVSSTLNFAQSTLPNTGKRKLTHTHHHNGYYRDVSPTPTIPPPMSRSLLSDHFLNL